MASIFPAALPRAIGHCSKVPFCLRRYGTPLVTQCATSYKLRYRNFCSASSIINIEKVRNIGIIAHIDAGKTTTTERMLYYSGITDEIGEVHDGDTVTDYLEQERERGITITSAAVTFPWKKHRINLIDTPGHVDFTVEVERALSVLDSAVVVLDASAGVEAQTITVWSQADRHKIPRIVYLNKMDKATADVDMCLNSIRKLGQTPVQIHLPLFDTSSAERRVFYGFIDLISMKQFKWTPGTDSDGTEYQVTPVEEASHLYEEASAHREELAGAIAELDEALSERVLSVANIDQITPNELTVALRRATISHKLIPVLCGSSYKNIGVQNVMDAIISVLPSPKDLVKQHTPFYEGHLCALAFKVIHHKRLGALTFVRLYTGEIKSNISVYNVNRNRKEKVAKVYVALADEFKEVASITAGNIVAISGLDCITGDTLVSSLTAVSQVRDVPKCVNESNLLIGSFGLFSCRLVKGCVRGCSMSIDLAKKNAREMNKVQFWLDQWFLIQFSFARSRHHLLHSKATSKMHFTNCRGKILLLKLMFTNLVKYFFLEWASFTLKLLKID